MYEAAYPVPQPSAVQVPPSRVILPARVDAAPQEFPAIYAIRGKDQDSFGVVSLPMIITPEFAEIVRRGIIRGLPQEPFVVDKPQILLRKDEVTSNAIIRAILKAIEDVDKPRTYQYPPPQVTETTPAVLPIVVFPEAPIAYRSSRIIVPITPDNQPPSIIRGLQQADFGIVHIPYVVPLYGVQAQVPAVFPISVTQAIAFPDVPATSLIPKYVTAAPTPPPTVTAQRVIRRNWFRSTSG